MRSAYLEVLIVLAESPYLSKYLRSIHTIAAPGKFLALATAECVVRHKREIIEALMSSDNEALSHMHIKLFELLGACLECVKEVEDSTHGIPILTHVRLNATLQEWKLLGQDIPQLVELVENIEVMLFLGVPNGSPRVETKQRKLYSDLMFDRCDLGSCSSKTRLLKACAK